MGFINPKFHRLTITGYKDKERSTKLDTYEALFNPESYQVSYGVRYQNATRGSLTQPSPSGTYSGKKPTEITFTLLLDSSGIAAPGAWGLSGATSVTWAALNPVKKQVDQFLKVCYDTKSATHQPYYLTVAWGQLTYKCRLSDVDINYTLFDRSGDPLRAELACTFVEYEDDKTDGKALNLQSPDITHMRVVRNGDTLPQLCQEVYGDPSYYMKVARANQLNHFRNLQPGSKIFFPPLVNS